MEEPVQSACNPLQEEYGFPESAQLVEGEIQTGDYLVDPEQKHIALAGRYAWFYVHKKNMLGNKVRQQSRKKPDMARFTLHVRIAPEDAPPAHQMVLLPKGSRVELPEGRFGKIGEDGIHYRETVLAFTDIGPEQIHDLHPPVASNAQRPEKRRNRPAGSREKK